MDTLEKKEFYRKLKSLAIPMAFQQLMTALVGVSDALMLGFISQDALSAVVCSRDRGRAQPSEAGTTPYAGRRGCPRTK